MSPGSRDRASTGEQHRLARRRANLRLRALLIQAVREFFTERGYLEVDTPLLIPAPAPEAHIEAIRVGGCYLQTSPELCMKRLLSSGFSRIFQISRCFRAGERGDLHLPEFSMLEWYRTGKDYGFLMDECESLILFLAHRLGRGVTLRYQDREIALGRPWERISVDVAFDRYSSVSLEEALAGKTFDQVMVDQIEPSLGLNRPTLLYDYPAPMAALARLKPDNRTVAERFELYMAGVELGNGFSELNDPAEQRIRFEGELETIKASGKEPYPMPERFLSALKHMPRAAGMALGVDRLTMLFCNAPKIDDVVPFTPEEL